MVSDRSEENLRSVLQMCEQMLVLANRGDEFRKDAGCGVVFGTLRDMAYKVRGLAEKELDRHQAEATKTTKTNKGTKQS